MKWDHSPDERAFVTGSDEEVSLCFVKESRLVACMTLKGHRTVGGHAPVSGNVISFKA